MTLNAILVKFYAEHDRSYLPWRKTHDPYKILVSEIMLQQTQVDRVLPKYKEFLQTFTTIEVLAKASFAEVLAHWSGLGYNRRAKFLHEAAKAVVRDFGGTLPVGVQQLQTLPGIGPYTARAVAAFAYNQPEVFIETNIRTVFTHYYFSDSNPVDISNQPHKIADAELLPYIAKDLAHSKMEPREFYAALMDYGSHLKHSGVRINDKSKHYKKQLKFEGSARQLRGAILRELLKQPATPEEMWNIFAHVNKFHLFTLSEIEREIQKLLKECLIQKKGKRLVVAK